MISPTIAEAEAILIEAAARNPGPMRRCLWGDHSRTAGKCARVIAEKCGMDGERAYVMGLLHDIGRREGVTDLRHEIDGYAYLCSLGYDDCARICLSHSFPAPGNRLECFIGANDCTDAQSAFLEHYLSTAAYDDYDRLIQLCDAIADADGVMIMERRLIDVVLRYGIPNGVLDKWRGYFNLKADFEARSGLTLDTLIV